jgi:hypothetical protein
MATEEQRASSDVFGDPESASLVPSQPACLRLATGKGKVKGIEVGHRDRMVTRATTDDEARPVS